MLKKIVITSVLAATTFAITANAALPSGLYVSGQTGYADTHMESKLSPLKTATALANDGLAGRLAIGYKLTNNIALELGYLQLATAKVNQRKGLELSNKQNAIDVAAKGMLPITNNVNLYGKIGAAYLTTRLQAKYDVNGVPVTQDLNAAQGIAKHKWAPEAAVGMGYDITKNVTVDTSFTRIQPVGKNRPGNINLLAVGVAYNFG